MKSRYLLQSKDNRTLQRKILSSDILVSDLDDTDVPSPAKKIACSSLIRPKYLVNSNFHLWCLKYLYSQFNREGTGSHSKLWKGYIELFLRNPKELERLSKKHTVEHAASTIYPEVREFYGLLPENMLKFYITRNIAQIVKPFADALHFDGFLAEQFDKIESIRRLMKKHPERKRYILKGDSLEDSEAVNYLKSKKRKGEIDGLVSILVSKNPEKEMQKMFDITIGRNYGPLVELLK